MLVEILLALAISSGEDPWARAERILSAARVWKVGDVIPQDLEEYRPFRHTGIPDDTAFLLSEITNLPLLTALVLRPGIEIAVSEEALARVFEVVGPTEAFRLIKAAWPTISQQTSWLKELSERQAKKHVVVDGMSVDDADMSDQQRQQLFDRVERDLRSGETWSSVYRRYSHEFGYDKGPRTKVGNLGAFVVFDDPRVLKHQRIKIHKGAFAFKGVTLYGVLGRIAMLPLSAVLKILAARQGDILRIRDADLEQWDLFCVREVYGPEAHNNQMRRTKAKQELECPLALPESLRSALSKNFPEHRILDLKDMNVESGDAKLYKDMCGEKCPGIAAGDFDGNGQLDYGLYLWDRNTAQCILVVYFAQQKEWSYEVLVDNHKYIPPGSRYIKALVPGSYESWDNIDLAAEDIAEGWVYRYSSKTPGIYCGRLETEGIAYFRKENRWVKLWF